MKKILSIVFFGVLAQSLSAQLFVSSNGNVGIKVSDDPVRSYLSVNSMGIPEICTYIKSSTDTTDIGLKVFKEGTSQTNNSDYDTGINSFVRTSQNSIRKNYGFYSHAYKLNAVDTNCGRSFGLYAIAGNSTPGWNYGVFGTLLGNNDGAGVFGSSLSWDNGIDTYDRYAGYFHGSVNITNTLYSSDIYINSDYKTQNNIETIGIESIDDLMKINVVKYNLKQRTIDSGDSTTIPIDYFIDDSTFFEKTHYGIIAQELYEIYPELVHKGGDGFLSVNYIEIIPLLIKAIQDLKTEISELKDDPIKSPYRNNETKQGINTSLPIVLYQNNPNPFTESTTIKCQIPKEISSAVLYIYDINGHQIESINITERGNITITLDGGRLDAGIYLYSLITDGIASDTKRMILTK